MKARLPPISGHRASQQLEVGQRKKDGHSLAVSNPTSPQQPGGMGPTLGVMSPDIWALALLLTGCVTLGKPTALSGPQGSHLLNKRIIQEQWLSNNISQGSQIPDQVKIELLGSTGSRGPEPVFPERGCTEYSLKTRLH